VRGGNKKVKHAIGQQVSVLTLQNMRLRATVSLSLCRNRGHSAPSPGQARLDWASPTKCEEETSGTRWVRTFDRFDDNACVLINKTGDPIGTRFTSKVMFPRGYFQADLKFQALSVQSYETGNGPKYCLAPLHV